MALPQNLRDIQFFILQGCWVPRLVWDLSRPCSWVCGQLWVGQMALLILSGSAHMSGNQLAEGWSKVVFAWITRVTQLCSICLLSPKSLVQTCPHHNGQTQEHEWNRQEAFRASSWNHYILANVHRPKQVTWLNSVSGMGKEIPLMMKKLQNLWQKARIGERGGTLGPSTKSA